MHGEAGLCRGEGSRHSLTTVEKWIIGPTRLLSRACSLCKRAPLAVAEKAILVQSTASILALMTAIGNSWQRFQPPRARARFGVERSLSLV